MIKKHFIDWHLLIPLIVILSLGTLILFSLSDSLGWFQVLSIIAGFILFVIFARFDYQHHLSLLTVYVLISFILIITPFLFGVVTRGSIRWIQLGFLTIQPSEIIKPFFIIIFASLLSKKNNWLIYLISLIIPVFLILKQPDLGSSLVIIAIWLAIWFASGLSNFLLGLTSFLALGLSPLIYHLLRPYQKQRILSFLNPYADPKGSGYQLIQSAIAVGSGRFFGQGLGSGTQSQLQFLPERHSDFIFASLAEQLGLFGSVILLTAIFFLLLHLIKLVKYASDNFAQMIIIGVFMMIFFQTAVNIGMNLGLLPITGITLPLVSAGGSSMISTMIALGIVHNISSQHTNQQSLEIK